MAATLPTPNQCCSPCDDIIIQQIAGPTGPTGAAGTNGTNGVNAFTTFTVDFTIPAELATGVATVADTTWMNISQKLYGAKSDGTVHAFFEVTAIGGATSVTLRNLEDTPTLAYTENSAPGSIITIGGKLMPAGIQGPAGNTTGAAGGDLKGTYPNPKIGIANTKGSSLWGNGTDTVAVAAGTNGHMLAYDSTDAEGVKSFKALPLTGDADLADNRIIRTDGATGLPVPGQTSRVTVTDTGAIQADGSGGNARGTDAIDLQVTRAAATQVASGPTSVLTGGVNNSAIGSSSFIGGGVGNSATDTRSIVVGGNSNLSRTQDSVVCGGSGNIAGDAGVANFRAAVVGGENNLASGQESFVGGGDTNVASGTQSAICGGDNNDATGTESFVGGGGGNLASATNASIVGGQDNLASATMASVAGGQLNTASGDFSAVTGGFRALANKYGQQAHASGFFAAQGDAQTSELTMRRATTDATPSELFLDGAALRCTVPNNTSWMFDIRVIARTSAGLDAIYTSQGVIRNNAGATTASAITTTEVFDGAGLPGGPVVVAADDPNDALIITVTGIALTNIRWVATVKLTEVAF